MEFIHLSVAQQQYLLPSENIQEIINYPNIKKVPNSPSHVEGLFNHKGSLVPLINVRKLLNFNSFEHEKLEVSNTLTFQRVIVYDLDGIVVGFTIDKVEKLYELDAKNFVNYQNPLSKSNQFIHFIDHYEIDGILMFSMKLIKKPILESIEEVVETA